MRSARVLVVALATLLARAPRARDARERDRAQLRRLRAARLPVRSDRARREGDRRARSTASRWSSPASSPSTSRSKISANMKVCYGCHGFEADMMYFDVRVADELNFRVGRFSPSFGAFNLRHDPANHRLSDKPLPYDMGRMLRMRQWNMSVLPEPVPGQRPRGQRHEVARLVGAARLRGLRGERLQGRPEVARHRLQALAQPAGLLRRRQRASHVRRSHGRSRSSSARRATSRSARAACTARTTPTTISRTPSSAAMRRCASTRRTSAPSTSDAAPSSRPPTAPCSSTSSPTPAATSR